MDTIRSFNERRGNARSCPQIAFAKRPNEQFAVISEDLTLLSLNYSITETPISSLVGRKLFAFQHMCSDLPRLIECIEAVIKTGSPMPFSMTVTSGSKTIDVGWTILKGGSQQMRAVYLTGGALIPVNAGVRRLTSA